VPAASSETMECQAFPFHIGPHRATAVITICSHCKRVISKTMGGGRRPGVNGEEQISHGICSNCLIVLENKIREKPEYAFPPPPPDAMTLKVKGPG